MLEIKNGFKAGEVFTINYSNDEYSFDDIINLISESNTTVESVTVIGKENPQLNTTTTFDKFLEMKDFILDSTISPGDTVVRLTGKLQEAKISVSMDPLSIEKILFTSNNNQIGLDDVLKKKEQLNELQI